MVAKDETSPYENGATRRWLKVKQKDWTLAEDRGSGASASTVTGPRGAEVASYARHEIFTTARLELA
jgi:hypothetical protein